MPNNKQLQPGKYDIVIYRGSTYQSVFKVTFQVDDTTFLDGADRLVMQIRPEAESSTVICTLSTDNGKITFDAVNANATLTIDELETNFFPAGNAVYDLEIHHGTTHPTYPNQITILLAGKVTIKNNVTRVTKLDRFGKDVRDITLYQIVRPLNTTDQINITTGNESENSAGKVVNNAQVRLIAGESLTTLGATANDFVGNNNLQFHDAQGNQLEKSAGGFSEPNTARIRWVNETTFLIIGSANIGELIFMVLS